MSGAALATVEQGGALARGDVLDLGIPVEQLIARVEKIQEVQTRVMKPDHHYGVVPGTSGKPSLFKPGAEILCLTFQLAPKFEDEDRWDGQHLENKVLCKLEHYPTGTIVGTGIGSCSTRESKYAWRSARRKCPQCGSDAALNKSKQKPEFYCWAKKGGCGATFPLTDKRITEQEVGRVDNPDLADQYNTVRKMACKRALVAAVLITCGASHLFTQDVEDMPRAGNDGGGDAGDSGGYDEERFDDEQRQQRGNGQQNRRSQNGDRPDDNRGRQQQGNGADAGKSNEVTAKMLKLFEQATSTEALDDLLPELNALKDERVLTLDDYKRLREAFGARSRELKGSARQSA